MLDFSKLYKTTELFYNKAVLAQQNQNFSIINQIIALANGAKASIKHLKSLSKYKNLNNLSIILQQFEEFYQLLINNQNNISSYLNKLKEILNNINFYTSPGNAGTGFDSVTTIKSEGYTPINYYVENLRKLINLLK